jgi:hypothetical protein
MAKGGSSSSTTQSTSNVYTDQSANAAAGGMAVGAGAKVDITTLDAEVAARSIEAQKETAGMALAAEQNVAGMSLAAQQNVSVRALDTTGQVAERAIDTSAAVAQSAMNTTLGLAQIGSEERQDVLATTDYALKSQQGVTEKLASLASSALERSQTPDSQVTKTMLYVAGAVVLLFGLLAVFAFRRPSRS